MSGARPPPDARRIPWEEVRRHANRESCWVVVSGRVLDVTDFLADHPGDEDVLLEAARKGADASEAFEEANHSGVARSMMDDYAIGRVAEEGDEEEEEEEDEEEEAQVQEVDGGEEEEKREEEQHKLPTVVQVDPPARAEEAATRAKAAPKRRQKVALPPGFSQMHWMQTMQRMPGQRPRHLTLDEVARHATADDAWMAVRGRVYDVTRYVAYHPGGKIILEGAGRDASDLFDRYHSWVNIEMMLRNCMVGVLQR